MTNFGGFFPAISLPRLGLLAIGLSTMAGIAGAEPARSVVALQTVDGTRAALLFSAGPGPHPVLLVLHGANGSGEAVVRKSGFVKAAANHGFTSVFPSGLDRRWHYGPSVRGTTADDIGYLHDLVSRLVKDGVADPKRVYIAGISNGGLMTFKMVCTFGGLFAGAATIIANLPAELQDCRLPAISYVVIDSLVDPVMPFGGGRTGLYGRGGLVLGAEQTAMRLVQADACRASPSGTVPIGKGVVETAWKDCKPNTSVTFFRVKNGGHTVPGTPPALNPAFGPTNEDLKASAAILDAFDSRG